MSDMADPGSIVETGLVVGMPALNMGSSLLLSQGDEAGTAGGGVACGQIMGKAEFVDGSMTVMVGGMPGVCLTGMTTQNANNTVGLVASRSEEHTSELQSLMRISYAVFCLKKKKTNKI